jgi:hypothetical protein
MIKKVLGHSKIPCILVSFDFEHVIKALTQNVQSCADYCGFNSGAKELRPFAKCYC